MQLELFPNDKLTFVTSLSSMQLNAIRATNLYTYHMIMDVRQIAAKVRSEEQYLERSKAKLRQLVEGLL